MIIDIVAALLVVLAFFSGFRRGIVYMVFFLAAFLIGIMAALKLSYVTTQYLFEWFSLAGKWLPLVSFILTFIIAFFLVHLVARFLENIFKFLHLNFVNKLLGGTLAAVIALFAISVGVWYAAKLQLLPNEAMVASVTLPHLTAFAPYAIDKLQQVLPFFGDLIERLKEMFEHISAKKSTALWYSPIHVSLCV